MDSTNMNKEYEEVCRCLRDDYQINISDVIDIINEANILDLIESESIELETKDQEESVSKDVSKDVSEQNEYKEVKDVSKDVSTIL